MPDRPDGRTARRDRNSEAVLDTVHEMFVEGNFSPSIEEVAARSGVSLRSVYRYFEDSEELLRMAIARRVSLVEKEFVLPDAGVGPLPQRITTIVNHRLVLHAKLGPSVRAALLRAPYSPLLAAQVARRRTMLNEQIEAQFAHEVNVLGARGKALAACADALCGFEAVEHLRFQRGFSVARTRKVMVTGLTALFSNS